MLKNIFVYVQHLLGTGHLHRTALITQALLDSGFEVTVVSGGVTESLVDFGKVHFIPLPAIKTDAAFTDLFDEYGNRVTADYKRIRTNILIRALTEAMPDFVLIETYPFGRRQMRFELLPLLQAIKQQKPSRPVVACSVRDVIQPKSNPDRIEETLVLLERYFDTVFVHGDKNFIEFEQTFPAAKRFNDKFVYTGYVTRPLTKALTHAIKGRRRIKSILVSAGGGAVGKTLYQTVISASKLTRAQGYDWHILVGNNLSEEDFRDIQAQQSEHLKVERNRNDFIDLLCQCSVSVSQGGYNTMMDILLTRTPALIVPFQGEAEQEQLIRASAFAESGIVTLLTENNLSESTLLKAITDCENSTSPTPPHIALNGADWLATFIKQQWIGHP